MERDTTIDAGRVAKRAVAHAPSECSASRSFGLASIPRATSADEKIGVPVCGVHGGGFGDGHGCAIVWNGRVVLAIVCSSIFVNRERKFDKVCNG